MKLAVYSVIVLLLQGWVNQGACDGFDTVSLQTSRLGTWSAGTKVGGDIKIAVRI
jgi:hypothetical protein